MGCDRFSQLISRYLDDDLTKVEAEELLQHLPDCVACRRELKSLERMRSWFEAADASAPTPEPTEEFRLARLLEEEGAASEEDLRHDPPLSAAHVRHESRGREGRWRGPGWSESIQRFLLPASPRGLWRFAVPLLAVLALGFWWQQERAGQGVDVSQLPASQTLDVVSWIDTADPDLDLYLLRHVAEQPLVEYGEEVPMVRPVSAGFSR